MAKITGARAVVECLIGQGVRAVFGIPGGAVLPLYDELFRARRRLRHVLCAHEQGAAHAADGYARASGGVGVAVATSGPGATNLVTGIATAWMDSSPAVFITGNVPSAHIGTDSFQEVDIIGVTMPVTKHNMLVRRAEDIPGALRSAFGIALSGRPGPVLVDIAQDAFTGKTEWAPPPDARISAPPVERPPLERALELILASERPLILAGGGVNRSRASGELLAFARALGAPVAATLMGIGCFPPENRAFLGHIGIHGNPAANRAAAACDLLIAVGTRFSDRTFGAPAAFASRSRVLHIDIDRAEIGKNMPSDASVVGDAGDILSALTLMLGGVSARPLWAERHDGTDRSLAAGLVRAAQAALPDAPVLADVGKHQMWAARYGRFSYPGQFVTSGGTGTMGFGLGAAIGACLAREGTPHILFTGDGGLMMNCGELATLSRLGLPLTVIVMNNRSLGMVRQAQDIFYAGRRAYCDTAPPDFAALAAAFGIAGGRAGEPDELRALVGAAAASGKPMVIDCAVPPDEPVATVVRPGGDIGDFLRE